jgi:hypothetical protein
MRTDHLDDAALLAALREALETPRAEPTLAERATFHALASQTFSARARWWPAGWLSTLRRPVPAVALAAIIVLAGVSAATVKRLPITDPVRSVAHSVGLPIESVELVETRRAMGDLRHALQSDDETHLAATADDLRAHLVELDAHDRAVVDDEATHLLDQADEALHHSDDETHEPDDPDTGVPSTPGTTVPPAPPSTSGAPAEHPEDDAPSEHPADGTVDHTDTTAPPSTPTSIDDHHDGGVDSDGSHTGGD